MKILLLEPYYTGSHKQWADGYKKYSTHDIQILSMKGQFWKWRMHGGAVTLGNLFNDLKWIPDLIVATDMLDLSTFLSITRKITYQIPAAIYFHENQLSYPWSPSDKDKLQNRDNHYSFINYSSALSADKVFFNSNFHMESFIKELRLFLKHFPDHQELDTIDRIRKKSQVLYLGMDFSRFNAKKIKKDKVPIILWNHRWEYDKNPELFFKTLEKIKRNGSKFKLVILGENFSASPSIFLKAKNIFESEIIHWGYCDSFTDYTQWLLKADILPVTSNQEFFGVSVVEAIYCGVWPILPQRLSYPELIPKELQSDHLYINNNDLYVKIKWALKNYEMIRKSRLSSIVSKFDWKSMAHLYDKILQLV
tara:strand:- start:55 stop:1149 length:1095 start_codon:yes stop_codon:yes gene_type:complete